MRSLLMTIAAFAFFAATPAHADWYRAKSNHFIIYSNDDPERLRSFAQRLEKFDQAVRTIRRMDDPPLTDSRRLTVYALSSGAAVSKLAGSSFIRGFYQGRADGSIAFVPRRTGGGDEYDLDAESVFFHEYAHHLQLQNSSMALPMWFTEGFAEFFATAQIRREGTAMIGSQPGYRLWSMFNDASGLTTEQILGQTFEKLNAEQMDRLYAQGWLLTHYLSFEESRQGQLDRYVAAIQRGMTPLDSARSAFGDLKRLNSELNRYREARRMTGIVVSAKALATGPIEGRPLNPGEAALMDVHIQSTRGVDEKSAPAIAANARKLAEKHGSDAFAQRVLAEAEFDVRNYAGADAAASRAIAANPNLVSALLYKGRAQMELARAEPARANWSDVRTWFLKANKVDTENAMALYLFYQSFHAAGQRPTKNAIDGLLYAAVLAPQDDGLRLTAFHQLLIDKRLPEAKKMFAPLAYDPHASAKWRETAGKIMAAIDRGDSEAALQSMTNAEPGKEGEAAKR